MKNGKWTVRTNTTKATFRKIKKLAERWNVIDGFDTDKGFVFVFEMRSEAYNFFDDAIKLDRLITRPEEMEF